MVRLNIVFLFGFFCLFHSNVVGNPIIDSLTNRLAAIEQENSETFIREKAKLSSEIADWYNKIYVNQDFTRTYLLKSTTYMKALESNYKLLPSDILFLSDVYRRLALYELQLGNVQESDRYMRECERLLISSKSVVPKDQFDKSLYDFYLSYFAMNFRMGKLSEALSSVNDAEKVMRSNVNLKSEEINLFSQKAILMAQMGDVNGSMEFAKKSLDIYENNPIPGLPHDRFIYFYLRTFFQAGQYKDYLHVLSKYPQYKNYLAMETYLDNHEDMVTRTFFENVFMGGISYFQCYKNSKDIAYLDSAYQQYVNGFRLGEKLTVKNDGDKIGGTILRPDNKINSLLTTVNELDNINGKVGQQKISEVIRIIDAYQSNRLHLERISYQLNADLWVKEKELKNEISYLNNKISELDTVPNSKGIIDSLSQIVQENTRKATALKAKTKRDLVMEQYKLSQNDFELRMNDYLAKNKKTLLVYFFNPLDSTIHTMGHAGNHAFFNSVKVENNFLGMIDSAYTLNASLQTDVIAIEKQHELNRALYSLLIDPIVDRIKTEELIIYPIDEFSYISFDALLNAQDEYLIENYSIQYTSSLFSIIHARKQSGYARDLAVFNPENYGTDSLAKLVHARQESIDLAERFDGLLIEKQLATKSAFLANTEMNKIVHLATHSILNFEHPYESYIVFDATEDLDSNHLYAYEIFAKNITAEMVVLSSCNSARGELKEGVGVLSLSNAFYFAGVPATVSSLWSAQDQSAADVMRAFYNNLQEGETKSKSLQKAKVKYLSAADKIHRQPFFWANYVVYGDDQKLFEKSIFSAALKKCLVVTGGVVLILLIVVLGRRIYRKSSINSAA